MNRAATVPAKVPAEVPEFSAWLAAARRVSWIPPAFASYDMPLDEAAARLRAPVALLARLLDAGLPAAGEADPRVDSDDIFNLGLELGWEGALPVVGFRGALRWLQTPSEPSWSLVPGTVSSPPGPLSNSGGQRQRPAVDGGVRIATSRSWRRVPAVRRVPTRPGISEAELSEGLQVNRVLAVALPGDAPLAITPSGTATPVTATFRPVVASGDAADEGITRNG